MLALFPLTIDRAAAAQDPKVTVGSVSGLAGSRIDLPVNFAVGTTGVSALEFDLILPIEINSTNGAPLMAASRVASQNGTGGFFEGLSFGEASLHQIIPHAIDTPELRTNLGINNTSGEMA